MQNDAFRSFLTERGAERSASDGGESKKAKAEDAQRKKEKAKAAQERRMAFLKKQEEQLAQQSKYRDRASERRTELEKKIQAGEAAPEEVPEAGMGAQAFIEEESLEQKEAALPSTLTFAQAGGREDLAQSQHRVSIEQSKYLGGDIEHTHLVKGLDFALLQKMRVELSSSEAAQAQAQQEKAARAEASRAAAGPKAEIAEKKGRASQSDLARGVQRALFARTSRPNRALLSGRLLLVFDVSEGGADVPGSLVRSEDDLLPEAERAAREKKLVDAGLPARQPVQPASKGRLAAGMLCPPCGQSQRSALQMALWSLDGRAGPYVARRGTSVRLANIAQRPPFGCEGAATREAAKGADIWRQGRRRRAAEEDEAVQAARR